MHEEKNVKFSNIHKIYTHVCQSELHVHGPFIYVGTFSSCKL